jgi:chaperonin cofactor prefoldin
MSDNHMNDGVEMGRIIEALSYQRQSLQKVESALEAINKTLNSYTQKTSSHGTIWKILGGFLVIFVPIITTWTYHLNDSITDLKVKVAVLEQRVHKIENPNTAEK